MIPLFAARLRGFFYRRAGSPPRFALFIPACMALLSIPCVAEGGDAEWRPLIIARFGNVDAVDAEDGELAAFVKSVKNDGRFTPPLRTFIGPEIRNLTFFGIKYEAWMECVVLVPARPGGTERVWIFPVDNRDEYMEQLAGQGLAEYEGMDGVSVLREMDQDGNIRHWHMEWLPGNVAVFGASREAVVAMRQLYAENSAARGLLAQVGGEYFEADITIRLDPERLIAWRDDSPGVYWWRDNVSKIVRDLVAYWEPGSARTRLVWSLSDEFVAWPRSLGRIDFGIWFERGGVEWRLDVEGSFDPVEKSELRSLRRVPEQTALAYALPVTDASFARLGGVAGRILLAAAGGVVTADARAAAGVFFDTLRQANIRQVAYSWVAPPIGRPELGGTRLVVLECEQPDRLEAAWTFLQGATSGETPVTQALSQIGWRVSIAPGRSIPGTADITIAPAEGDFGAPYYWAAYVARRQGNWVAFAGGGIRADSEDQNRVMSHRADLAHGAVTADSDGIPDARLAFTRVGPDGASFLGFLKPVRFMQLSLIEAADLRPRTSDQLEPLSSQVAREMLEYGTTTAWTVTGEKVGDVWRFNGGMPWSSLTRLSAALGITESVGVE